MDERRLTNAQFVPRRLFTGAFDWAGRAPLSRLGVALLTLCAVWVYVGAVHGAGSLRVLVVDPPGSALAQRVEGQLAGTEWRVLTLGAAEAMGDPIDVSAAKALATQHGAAAAVWFLRSHEVNGWHFDVLDVRRDEVLTRQVLGRGESEVMASSALDELTAIAVREALLGISEREATPAVVPPLEAAVTAGVEKQRRLPDDSARHSTSIEVGAGWQVALDGESPRGQQGPVLSAAVFPAGWGIWLSTGVSLGANLDDSWTKVEMVRRDHFLGASWRVPGAGWAVDVSLGGGAVAFSRRTHGVSSLVQGTGQQTTWSPGMRLAASPSLQLGSSGFSLAVSAAADYVPRAPTLAYDSPTGLRQRNNLWVLQPVAAISCKFRLP
ncbi:MAG: hypothetical protein RJA70_2080 [Pseudomonadota bacterium]|jgi:hypothetical protein